MMSLREAVWSSADLELARMLFTVWAARTGRTLPAIPVTDLSAEDLIEFWADDQIDYPPVRS